MRHLLEVPIRRNRLLVSLLVFSGTENIQRLLDNLPEGLAKFAGSEFSVTVTIRCNNPQLDTSKLREQVNRLSNLFQHVRFVLIEAPANVGFGRGHNENFRTEPSDFFLILNDDLEFLHFDWLAAAINLLENDQDMAFVGHEGNPKYLSPFFANGGFESEGKHYPLRYVEASVLVANSSIFERIGMFDESLKWAMSEDADLSLMAQSLGYRIGFIDIPHQHWRSTSFNLLPSHAKVSVKEHNRARLFAKWGHALASGEVGNVEVLDVFSVGIGDVFCGLVHIDNFLRALPASLLAHFIVNTSHPDLARLILPDGTRIEAATEVETLYERFKLSSVRTTRGTNYALPFNMHSVLAASLSVPLATREQARNSILRAVGGPATSDGTKTRCLIHLEFFREGHDGRGPSRDLKVRIIREAASRFDRVLLIGASQWIDLSEVGAVSGIVEDLQGQQRIVDLMRTIAEASCFIGIDSFPAHVAQMLTIPSVVLFGSVHPAMRVWSERSTWPLYADLNCIGCYHEQIEPHSPFCMRRDMACMRDIPQDRIAHVISDMMSGRLFDWTELRKREQEVQAKFFHLLLHHPAPPRHFLRPLARNEQVSNLIYELTEKIANQVGVTAQTQIIRNLRSEINVLRGQLQASQAKEDARYQEYGTRRLVHLFTDERSCAAHFVNDFYVCDNFDDDPQIDIAPITMTGGPFRMSITATCDKLAKLKVYYRSEDDDFDEGRVVAMDVGPDANTLTFSRFVRSPETVYFRIDPADRPSIVKFSGELIGAFEVQGIN